MLQLYSVFHIHKFFLPKHHSMKTYRGRESMAPDILNLGTRWSRGVTFTPRPLYLLERAPGTHAYKTERNTRPGLDVVVREVSLPLPEIGFRPSSPQPRHYSDKVAPPPSKINIKIHKNIRAMIAQSVQRWATGWTIGVLRFDCRRRLGIFLFTIASRTALGPTSLLTNGYQGFFPWG
jgi:hypothetical protein